MLRHEHQIVLGIITFSWKRNINPIHVWNIRFKHISKRLLNSHLKLNASLIFIKLLESNSFSACPWPSSLSESEVKNSRGLGNNSDAPSYHVRLGSLSSKVRDRAYQRLHEKLSSLMGWKSQEKNEMVTHNEAEVFKISCDWKLGGEKMTLLYIVI